MALKIIWEQTITDTDDILDATIECSKSIAKGETLQFTVIDEAGKVYSVDLNEKYGDEILEVAQNDLSIYQQLENAIIRWNNDSTKTAGSLTRELLSLLKK
jgi:hypothetical protein